MICLLLVIWQTFVQMMLGVECKNIMLAFLKDQLHLFKTEEFGTEMEKHIKRERNLIREEDKRKVD